MRYRNLMDSLNNVSKINTIKLILYAVAMTTLFSRQTDATVYDVFQSMFRYYRNFFNLPPGVTKDTNNFKKEYDFIIVGAGSGGSVLANRLTEIPEWSVLLLEAGREEILLTDVPLLVSYIIGTDYNWGYRTEKQDGICMAMKNGRCHWPRGRAMGGTSVINYMVYTRGYKDDYDNWERLGNYGWSFRDVLPYFLKSEDVGVDELKNSTYHSTGGYLKVREAGWKSPIASTFIEASKQLGYRFMDSGNFDDFGCSYVLANIDHGARCSASKAFLRPIRRRKNLFVAKEARVTKILIDEVRRRAIGVEFIKHRKRYSVRANKEVILSAGTLNSPQLLMLSGIGPKDHLQQLAIPVVQDLKVGYNLHDHVSMAGLVFMVNDTVTIVEERYRNPKYVLDYLLNGSGPYTIPGGAEAVLFTKTNPNNNDNDKLPDIELVFGPGALTGDSGGSLKEMLSLNDTFFNQVYSRYSGEDAWSLVPVLLQPRSRGYMKLRSKNPFHPPLFYPNYFQDERDLITMIEGIQLVSNRIIV